MMHNKNVANATWIIGCKIIQALLGIVISMLTARYLGPSNFGLINFAAAIVAFVEPITTLGLPHTIVQAMVCAPEAEGKILGTSITMSLLSGIVCVIGIVSFSIIINPNDMAAALVCGLYGLLLFAKALELIQYWFQAKLMSKYTAVISVIGYILISIYKVILLVTKKNIYWFAVSNAIDHFMIGVALLVVYHRKSRYTLQFSFAWAKKMLCKSKYFIVAGMMVTIFAQTDKIMLRFMIDSTATGIYSAASSCASVTSFVFVAIIDSMRPTIIENKVNSISLYETNICRLYSVIIYLAVAQSLTIALLAKPIIWILYGTAFFDSVSALRIIVWQSVFSYMGAVRNVWMLAEEQQQYLWKINLCGALANVVLNIFMIRQWGVEGAALASLLTQFFTNVVIGFIFKPIRRNNYLMLKSWNPKVIIGIVKSVLRQFP